MIIPSEILGEVFTFLSYRLLFSKVRKICREWNQLITDGSTIQNSSIKIAAICWMKEERRQSFWECCKAGYFNKSISSLKIRLPKKVIWNQTEREIFDSNDNSLLNYFRNIKSLSLKNSMLGSENFRKMLQNCHPVSILEGITELSVEDNSVSGSDVELLLRMLPNLTSINVLSNPIDEKSLDLLLTNSKIKSILTGVNEIKEETQLTKMTCSKIEKLTISNLDYGDSYFKLLFDKNNRELLNNLTHLDLMDTLPTKEGLAMFKNYPYQTNITYLNLEYNELKPKSIEYLTQSRALSNLKTLLIPNNGIHSEGFQLITKCPFFCNITKLDVCDNIIGGDGFKYFGTQEFTLKKLIHLKCSSSSIGEQGFSCLFKEPSLSGLKKLKISETNFDDASAVHLLSANFSSLKVLDLEYNDLTDKGLETLSQLKAPKLEKIICGGSDNTTYKGALYFLENSSIPNLNSLDLDYEQGKEQINNSKEVANTIVQKYPRLTDLIYYSHTDIEILKIFLDGLSELKCLCINDNITDDHIDVLTNHPQASKLEELYFAENMMTDKGAKLIAECALLKNLKVLSCENNLFTDEGYKAIFSSRNLISLTTLFTKFNEDNFTNCELLNIDYVTFRSDN